MNIKWQTAVFGWLMVFSDWQKFDDLFSHELIYYSTFAM